MRESELSQNVPIKDTGRTPGERPPEVEQPNQGWQIDATKIYTKLDGWVWQTSVLDMYDRRIVGYVVRKTCRAEDAEDALAIALDRTLKEECIWLSEWESLGGLEVAVSQYVDHYNLERIHSALDYLTPMEMHRLATREKTSLQIAA